jgi:hypothetical protein
VNDHATRFDQATGGDPRRHGADRVDDKVHRQFCRLAGLIGRVTVERSGARGGLPARGIRLADMNLSSALHRQDQGAGDPDAAAAEHQAAAHRERVLQQARAQIDRMIGDRERLGQRRLGAVEPVGDPDGVALRHAHQFGKSAGPRRH